MSGSRRPGTECVAEAFSVRRGGTGRVQRVGPRFFVAIAMMCMKQQAGSIGSFNRQKYIRPTYDCYP